MTDLAQLRPGSCSSSCSSCYLLLLLLCACSYPSLSSCSSFILTPARWPEVRSGCGWLWLAGGHSTACAPGMTTGIATQPCDSRPWRGGTGTCRTKPDVLWGCRRAVLNSHLYFGRCAAVSLFMPPPPPVGGRRWSGGTMAPQRAPPAPRGRPCWLPRGQMILRQLFGSGWRLLGLLLSLAFESRSPHGQAVKGG